MRFCARIRGWLFGVSCVRAAPSGDPIADRLRAAVDANAKAKIDNSRCHATRVHAMIEDLFHRMERDGRPHV